MGEGYPTPEACIIGSQDLRLLAWERDVEAACREGRTQVGNRLGLFATEGASIRCVVAPRESRRLSHDDWRYATTSSLPGGSVEVFFAAEAVAAGVMRLSQTAVHEMTHAVMRARMGDAYAKVDPWFREGVAVWVAEQGEDRLKLDLARALHAGRGTLPRPEALLDGLLGELGEAQTGGEYSEDYLAIRWLEEKRGPQAVGEAVRKVVDGVAPLVALADAAGVDPGKLIGKVDEFARRWIREAMASLRASSLKRCGRLLDRARPQDAAACYARFLEHQPDSPLRDAVRMLAATSQARSGRRITARKLFQSVTASHSVFADEAWWRISDSYDNEGRPRPALDSACAALRSGFTRHAPQLAFVAGRSLLRLDQPEEAIPWLERVSLRYPTSAYADLARKALAEARQRVKKSRPTPPPLLPSAGPDADGGPSPSEGAPPSPP